MGNGVPLQQTSKVSTIDPWVYELGPVGVAMAFMTEQVAAFAVSVE